MNYIGVNVIDDLFPDGAPDEEPRPITGEGDDLNNGQTRDKQRGRPVGPFEGETAPPIPPRNAGKCKLLATATPTATLQRMKLWKT